MKQRRSQVGTFSKCQNRMFGLRSCSLHSPMTWSLPKMKIKAFSMAPAFETMDAAQRILSAETRQPALQ